MGIPLAALNVRPVEPQPGPLDQYAKAVQLKSLLQAQQFNQQDQPLRIEAQQQENQQREIALKDQQAQTSAMKDWDGKNLQDLPGLLLKHGGSATAVFGLKSKILEQQTALTKLDTDTLANQSKKNDYLLGSLQAATSGPDEGLSDRINAAAMDAVKKGYLDPQHAQGIQQLTQQIQDPKALRDQLGTMEKSFMGQQEQFKQEKESRETAARELSAKTGATRLQAEMPGGPLQPIDQKEYSDFIAKNPGKGPTDFAKWKASLNPQAQIVAQGGAPSSALATAVANGQMKIADVLTARTPLPIRKQFLSDVLKINPDFKSYDFDIEKGVMKSATSGKIADNLTAFNTAIDHASQLSKATDALGNGDMPSLNKIGNALGYQFGSDKTTNFNVIKNALSGEISKVFKGGQATDAEIHAVQAPFDAANSPAQLKGAINNAIKLMGSKRDALKQQVEKGMKGEANFGEEKGKTEHPFFSNFGGQTRP